MMVYSECFNDDEDVSLAQGNQLSAPNFVHVKICVCQVTQAFVYARGEL